MKNNKNIVIYLLLLFIFVMIVQPLTDSDTFWHLKLGEYIFENRSVPVFDVFSWHSLVEPLEMYPHEWLSQLIFYVVFNFLAESGFVLFISLLGVLLLLYIYKKNEEYFNGNLFITFCLFVFAGFMLSFYCTARPQIFEYFFLLFTIFTLNDYRNGNKKIIWTLPILMILWINFHAGSSAIMFVLIIVLFISSFFNFDYCNIYSKPLIVKDKITIIKVFICSILAAFINPMGYKLVIYPYVNMASNLMKDNIKEWQPATLNAQLGFMFFILLALILFILICSNKKKDLYDLLMLALFTYMSLSSVKFIIFFILYGIIIFAKYINYDYINKYFKFYKAKYNNVIILILVLLPIMGFQVQYDLFMKNYDNFYKLDPYPSDEIVSYIKEVKPKKLYNSYAWGGYLIFNDIPVFIDGRLDLYLDDIFKDYLSIENEFNFETIEKYCFDYMIIRKNSNIGKAMYLNENYELYLEDEVSLLYKRL